MEPVTTLEVKGRVFNVYTLPSYTTAYYFCKEFGSVNHFMTLRRLKNFIARKVGS